MIWWECMGLNADLKSLADKEKSILSTHLKLSHAPAHPLHVFIKNMSTRVGPFVPKIVKKIMLLQKNNKFQNAFGGYYDGIEYIGFFMFHILQETIFFASNSDLCRAMLPNYLGTHRCLHLVGWNQQSKLPAIFSTFSLQE